MCCHRPLVVLADVGQRSDLHAGDVCVLVQDVDIVMGGDPDDGRVHRDLHLGRSVPSLLRHDSR